MLQVRKGKRRLVLMTVASAIAMIGVAQAQDKDPRDAGDHALWQRTLLEAEAGRAVAQCDLGELIVRGKEAQRGMKVAAKWFAMAAEQEALCGLMRMGEFHRRGTGVEKNLALSDGYYARALPTITVLAREGDLEMQIQLAKMHHKALGTKEDLDLAGFWYHNAAVALEPLVEAGDIDAHKKLANILIIGIGIDRDVERAGRLYEVAAVAGDRAGLYLAGSMWFTGRGKHPVDHERGFNWLHKAAEIDHPRSQAYVGTAFAQGLGVEADPVEAVKWLQLAIDRGVGAAKPELKELSKNITAAQLQEGKALAADWVPLFDRAENKSS